MPKQNDNNAPKNDKKKSHFKNQIVLASKTAILNQNSPFTDINGNTIPNLDNNEFLKKVSGTFEQEIDDAAHHDGKVWQAYLNSKPTNPVSQERIEITKRLFYFLEQEVKDTTIRTNLDSATNTRQTFSADQAQNLTLGSMISHGGRVSVIVPAIAQGQNPNELFSWLVGGASNISLRKGMGSNPNPNVAMFERTFATHSANVSAVKNPTLRNIEKFEKRPKRNPLTLTKDYVKKRHFGMNVGLGTEEDAMPDNGTNGHLYLYWKPPTTEKPGALLIGCETSAPGLTDKHGQTHTAKAVSNDIGPTGGRKFRAYRDAPNLPTDNSGIIVQPSATDINQIISNYSNDPVFGENISTKLSMTLPEIRKTQPQLNSSSAVTMASSQTTASNQAASGSTLPRTTSSTSGTLREMLYKKLTLKKGSASAPTANTALQTIQLGEEDSDDLKPSAGVASRSKTARPLTSQKQTKQNEAGLTSTTEVKSKKINVKN